MGYSTEFKESVIQKVLTSDRPQHEIASEVGIGRSTLQYWLRVYRKNGVNEMPRKEKRPRDWTAEERFAALMETARMSNEELGAWCRRHGLHTHHLEQWKREALSGCGDIQKRSENSKIRSLQQENKALKKELKRKEKALAETAALLVLKKKAESIWGEGAED
jgi:transposase